MMGNQNQNSELKGILSKVVYKFILPYISLYMLIFSIIFINKNIIFNSGRLFFVDLQISLDVKTTLTKYGYTWYYANGWGNYVFPFLYPQIIFHLVLSGFNVNMIEKNILLISFIGGVLSYYLFTTNLIKEKEKSKSLQFHIAFLISGIYFLFNAEIIRRLYQPGFFKGYLFIPLFLYLLIKSFNNNRLFDKYLILAIILFPLIFASSPHYFVYYMLILIVFSLFTLTSKNNKKLIIIKLFCTFGMVLLISSYFILPFILFPKSPTQSGFYVFKTDIPKSESLWDANLLKHLTLTAGWIQLSDTFNQSLIKDKWWLTLGSILFLIAILTMLFPRKILEKYIFYDKFILILLLLIISFILYLGYFFPLSSFIYDNIIFKSPIDWVFRVITRIVDS